mgnify:CR=1 FL=1
MRVGEWGNQVNKRKSMPEQSLSMIAFLGIGYKFVRWYQIKVQIILKKTLSFLKFVHHHVKAHPLIFRYIRIVSI